jgi:hypothetical protein
VRIAHNFLATMEMPLLAGRDPTERDNMAAPKVAIINGAAVRKFFPTEDALGRRFGTSPETSDQIEVVGVIRDAELPPIRQA